jgi:inosine/xanthosine triphosphate pyrophosphatase family protein
MSVPVRTVVLASRNPDKLRELRQIVAGLPLKVVSSEDFPGLPEVIEDGTTALGNATRKALVTAAYTGEIAVADDTSFQVRTLGGLPDVFASRFAGPEATYADNAALVLELVRAVPLEARDARFEASLVWIDPQPPAGLKASAATPEHARWLHNPFARSIGLAARGPDAETFWNELCDRRRIWSDYRADAITLPVGWGADTARAVEIVERLVAPYLGGGRPKNAPAEAVWLPDTRLWTASGPDDQAPPRTMIAPEGLPADAPGRSVTSRCGWSWPRPDGCRAASPASRWAAWVSATTRSSSPWARNGPWPSCRRTRRTPSATAAGPCAGCWRRWRGSTARAERACRRRLPGSLICPRTLTPAPAAPINSSPPGAWRAAGGRPGAGLVLTSGRGVAQSGSATALGAVGRRFKSCRPDQCFALVTSEGRDTLLTPAGNTAIIRSPLGADANGAPVAQLDRAVDF